MERLDFDSKKAGFGLNLSNPSLGPIYMVLGTRDNPLAESTFPSIYTDENILSLLTESKLTSNFVFISLLKTYFFHSHFSSIRILKPKPEFTLTCSPRDSEVDSINTLHFWNIKCAEIDIFKPKKRTLQACSTL